MDRVDEMDAVMEMTENSDRDHGLEGVGGGGGYEGGGCEGGCCEESWD